MLVIIPSIRNINPDFIRPLVNNETKIIVVDDTDDESIRPVSENMIVLHYSDRKKMMGQYQSCIPLKNGACRDFGLWYAYLHGKKNETVVCLDDDCEVPAGYPEIARQSLGKKKLPAVTTTQPFYNLIDIYGLKEEIFPRGFPYEERGREKDYRYDQTMEGNVVFNLGLWDGIFDVNAIDKLYLSNYNYQDYTFRHRQVIVQPGALVSLCSMNMILTRDVIPALYQLPMNEPVIPNWTIDRYGDIWGGYIGKKLIDIKGDLLSVGEPRINHLKDGSPEVIRKNIRQEHFAHIVNMSFCRLIEKACDGIKPSGYLEMYEQLVENLMKLQPEFPAELKKYMEPTVDKMNVWVKALKMNI